VNPQRVIDAAKKEGVTIEAVLTTHHHSDHAGGNDEIKTLLKNEKLPIYGMDERIRAVSKVLSDKDELKCGSIEVCFCF
jgi:hydroxyacylglutathione hydrolase